MAINRDKVAALQMMENNGLARLQAEHDEAYNVMFDEHGTKRRVLLADGKWLTPNYHSRKLITRNTLRGYVKQRGISISGSIFFTGKEAIFEPKYGMNERLCASWLIWEDTVFNTLNDFSWLPLDRQPTDEEVARMFKQKKDLEAYKQSVADQGDPNNELESTLDESTDVLP